MENLVFTQLSIPEIRAILRQELETCFANQQNNTGDEKNSDQLLNIQQAAQFLHLSTFTIYGLVSRSEIPSMKRGKRLYFSREDLTSWVKETRRGTVCDAAKEADAYLSTKRKRG